MKTKFVLSFLLVIFACTLHLSAKDYYVKTTGLPTNDGISWKTPLTLDAALSHPALSVNDVIHIAAGTYVPANLIASADEGLTDRDKTFEIYKNVTLIGGYPANSVSAKTTSNPKANVTILSGDLGASGKAYHTLVITAPQVKGEKVSISGVTIKNGNGNGEARINSKHNSARIAQSRAGGVYAVQSTVELIDCDIIDNHANSGPALTTALSANVTLTRCNVERNNAAANGGGIFVEGPKKGADAVLTVYDSTVANNEGGSTASGIYAIYTCKVFIYNSTISNNSCAGSGAGVYVREGTKGYIVNSTIHGNTAGTSGKKGSYRAGLTIYGQEDRVTSFDAISTTITANNGYITSGLEVVQYATSNIYNCLISGNNGASVEIRSNYKKESNYVLKNSIVADKIYNSKGVIVRNVTFDKRTIGKLESNEKSTTKTCMISGKNNPALAGYGLTVAELEKLANTYTPAISNQMIATDQVGQSRDGHTVIGALINPKL